MILPQILIVDDEPDTCDNLSDIFTDLGYAVDIAHEGFTALDLVSKKHYDVALLDLKMPGMDGLELYRRLRQISAGTVAIVVTAYASSSTANEVLKAGAWRILSKPVDFGSLRSIVEQAVEQPLVLLVDDDHELCDSLWDLFRERAYRVSVAHDVPSAQRLLQTAKYQVVLIDMKLPHGSGADVLHSVQQSNPQAGTVLITGYLSDSEQLVSQSLGEGANAVCYKPFNMDQLLDTVRELTGRSDSRPS